MSPLSVVVLLVVILAPSAVFSQVLQGCVTTGPFPAAMAPVLSPALLTVLALALAVGAVIALGRRSGNTLAVLVVIAGTAALLGVARGSDLIEIRGEECDSVVTRCFDLTTFSQLENLCPEPILIIDIDVSGCEALDGSCSVGDGLENGDTCTLPDCTHL